MIKKVIPVNAFLRDFAQLQDTDSFLVLYISSNVSSASLDPEKSVLIDGVDNEWVSMGCSASDFGQTIFGRYKLALIRNNRIINEIGLPFPDFENWPIHRFETPDPKTKSIGYTDMNDPSGTWKDNGGLMFRHARCILENFDCKGPWPEFVETRQLVLTDLTGDGMPYEVRFMTEHDSCGNDFYVVAGYNPETDRVMIYNMVDYEGTHPSYINFDPSADGTVIYDNECDHGSEKHKILKFKFDQKQKEYIIYDSTEFIDCLE